VGIALPVVQEVAEGCCAPVMAGVLDADAAETFARAFKALGDPARVRLLSIIAAQPDREACGCDLTGPLGLTQPTVSHHLKVLTDAGILAREQRGRWAFYRLLPGRLQALADALGPGGTPG
jgi:ArsR family transcriptional regulator